MGAITERLKMLEERVMAYFEDAVAIKLQLASDEDSYDYEYIMKKMTECSTGQEKLSDIQMQLTRISLDVTKLAREATYLLKTEEKILKSTPEYLKIPAKEGREGWLSSKLSDRVRETENLQFLNKTVYEVRNAVADRIQTMRRLDSDLRSYQKMLEIGGGSRGAKHPASYTGDKKTDIDI